MSPVHLHLILNHVPILLLWLGLLTLFLSPFLKSCVIIRYGLSLIVLSALAVIPVYLSGGKTEHAVENLPQVSETYIEAHEQAAKISLILTELAGALALIVLWLDWKKGSAHKALWVLLLLLLAWASITTTWTGNLGGQIRHSEIRPVQPNNEASTVEYPASLKTTD